VVNDHIFLKEEQPAWPEGREWMNEHVLD
jgi:hypothetical protein